MNSCLPLHTNFRNVICDIGQKQKPVNAYQLQILERVLQMQSNTNFKLGVLCKLISMFSCSNNSMR